MAVGDETIGYGCTCHIDDGGTGAASGAAYTLVDKLVGITVPARKTGTTESKRLDLPTRLVKKIATLVDGGELTLKQQFTNAGYARLEIIRNAYQENLFKITVQDDNGDTTIIVKGIVTENKIDNIESDKITEFETMVTISGESS